MTTKLGKEVKDVIKLRLEITYKKEGNRKEGRLRMSAEL